MISHFEYTVHDPTIQCMRENPKANKSTVEMAAKTESKHIIRTFHSKSFTILYVYCDSEHHRSIILDCKFWKTAGWASPFWQVFGLDSLS